MSDDSHGPDPMEGLDGLLDLARTEAGPGGGAKARVWDRLAEHLPPPPSGGEGGAPTGGEGAAPTSPALPTPPVEAAIGGFGAKVAGLLGATVFVMGGLSVLEPRTPPPEPPSITEPAVRAAAPAKAVEKIEVRPVPPTLAPEPELDDALAAEQALLARAGRALTEGDGLAALKAIERHRARFPRGRLAEERDALNVRALARVGRSDDARAAAEHFRERYPDSLLRSVVDEATRR